MAFIKCPSCGESISLNAQSCSNCGFNLDSFYSDVDSLYKYGIKHLDDDPHSSYYVFHIASQIGHAPSMFQLGFLFRRNVIFPRADELTRKKNFEHCLVESASMGYDLALKNLFLLKDVLITIEAIDFVNGTNFNGSLKNDYSFDNKTEQLIIDKAKEDFAKIKAKFNKIKRPYKSSASQICKLYNQCIKYADTILYSHDFFEKLEVAYEEVHK